MSVVYRYINGGDEPSLTLIYPSGVIQYAKFTDHIQAVNEFDTDEYIVHELFNGSDEQEFYNTRLEWELDFSGLLIEADAMTIEDVKKCERLGGTILLKPHDGTPRVFQCFTVKEKRKLGMHYSGDNKDYVLRLYSCRPLQGANWMTLDNTFGIAVDVV